MDQFPKIHLKPEDDEKIILTTMTSKSECLDYLE